MCVEHKIHANYASDTRPRPPHVHAAYPGMNATVPPKHTLWSRITIPNNTTWLAISMHVRVGFLIVLDS